MLKVYLFYSSCQRKNFQVVWSNNGADMGQGNQNYQNTPPTSPRRNPFYNNQNMQNMSPARMTPMRPGNMTQGMQTMMHSQPMMMEKMMPMMHHGMPGNMMMMQPGMPGNMMMMPQGMPGPMMQPMMMQMVPAGPDMQFNMMPQGPYQMMHPSMASEGSDGNNGHYYQETSNSSQNHGQGQQYESDGPHKSNIMYFTKHPSQSGSDHSEHEDDEDNYTYSNQYGQKKTNGNY